MAKTTFIDGNPSLGILGTQVLAAFLNSLNNHRHTGRDIDGEGALDYAETTGSDNAYMLTLSPALDAYIAGMPIYFKASFTNTGAATININSLGAVALKKHVSDVLEAGDILIGKIYVCVYDGTNLQIINPSKTSDIPIGTEMLWPAETPPDGWLEEDGSSLVRATYANLFAVIGTMYGTADSTHFNLPDARGRFPRIWDHTKGNDPDRASRTAPTATGATITAGDHVGTNQSDEYKSHVHSGASNYALLGTSGSSGYMSSGYPTTGSSGGNETRPINTNRMLIIKAY